jgi:sarcosine oxidase
VGASRQSVVWFAPHRSELFTPERFPVFNLELDGEHVYGFPEFGVPGVKIGRYDRDTPVVPDPDRMSREVEPGDEATLRPLVERYLPDAAGRVLDVRTCPFDPSPDEDFVIDRHPESERAVVATGFSGRGFKFCSVVGEILADLVLEGETAHDISRFRLGRFA